VGKPKYCWAEGGKSVKCIGVSQLLGARARAALPPKVYAYAVNETDILESNEV